MSSGIKFHRVHQTFGGEHFRLPHVEGQAVKDMLEEIGFSIPYKPKVKLNQEYDIPYLMGYDTDKDIVYGDKDFKLTSFDGSLKPKFTLLTHEEVEKLLERFHMSYQSRHHIATHCEKLMADHLGMDWREYTAWTTRSWHQSYAKWGKKALLRVPATLDMSPYVDEADSLVKEMRQAGAKDKGDEG
jgi:hypothetical protein